MIRVIGDVHGKIDEYKEVIEGAAASVQVGDMAFDYSGLKELDPQKHRFIGGNHDNYDTYYDCLNAFGDFGPETLNGVEYFGVRGSFSIDCLPRVKNYILTQNKTWWYEEELSIEKLRDAIELYSEIKPNFVITHDCPSSVKHYVSKGPQVVRRFGWPDDISCRTQQALSVMFNEHKPKLWIFGHWHIKRDFEVDGTRFICLPELGFVNVDKNLEVYP